MSEQRMMGREEPVGIMFFASLVMILIGAFHVVVGLSGITDDAAFGAAPNYLLEFTTTAWGWIHIIFALIMVFAGMSLIAGASWARVIAIVAAMVSALVGFAFSPLYAVWAIVLVAADLVAVWALAAHREAILEG